MIVGSIVPLIGLVIIQWVPAVRPDAGHREPFWTVIARIWRQGAAVGLQGVGFAALGAFFSLYYLSRGWPYAGLGLTSFGVGFVIVRALFGKLPDRIGGKPVAAVSLLLETCGQIVLWLAPAPWAGLLGALLTGIGCSMVFPAMGSEAVKRVPPQLRGTAIGGFAAFQDIAYGATAPLVGILADSTGYVTVFLIGAAAAAIGFVMVLTTRSAAGTPATASATVGASRNRH